MEFETNLPVQLTDTSRFHDKRKVQDNEDSIQAKRICQPIEATKKKSSTLTLHSRKKSDNIKRLDKKEIIRHSSSQSQHEDDNDNLFEKGLLDQHPDPEEIEMLRQNLEDGNLEIRHFNWVFWNTLNTIYGTILGYMFGFLVIIWKNHWWMWEEFADSSEGHSVGKTLVVLFVIYSYSFINLCLEQVQFTYLTAKIFYPNFCIQLKEEWSDLHEFILNQEKLSKLWNSKYFYTPFAVLWCMFSAYLGSEVWLWFWWNHICKTYHDKTCRKSWIGQLVIRYRDDACYDGTASSAMCEKLVSYFPIMLFSVIFVFLGNVILPLINDWLSIYYPISPKLEAAYDIMQSLNQSSDGGDEEKEGSPKCDFTFRKTFEFDDGDVDVPKLNPVVPAGSIEAIEEDQEFDEDKNEPN